MFARAQVETDLGLAKAVNRLHRIADGEQRATIAMLPAGRQRGEQLVLAARGVLELVDQHMLQPVVEAQRQVRRLVRAAQGAARAHLDFGKIHLAVVPEHQLQLARCVQQYCKQARQHGLLLHVQALLWQLAKPAPQGDCLVVGAQPCTQVLDRLLVLLALRLGGGCDTRLAGCREADIGIPLPAGRVAPCQHQLCQAEPLCKIRPLRAGCRRVFAPGPE